VTRAVLIQESTVSVVLTVGWIVCCPFQYHTTIESHGCCEYAGIHNSEGAIRK
jgi:hypothetical protein